MKILFASDSFKGTLSSERTIELLEKAAKEVFGDVECTGIPVADGGEGTAAAVVSAESGEWIEANVCNPLGKTIKAKYRMLDKNRAIIEMAAASGLTLLPVEKRNPLYTTTYGTGQLILDALEKGFTDISIAIGGSATNDGGMGCAKALGVRFLDKNGLELEGVGEDLEKVCEIDISNLDKRIRNTKITVMCDVTNPLCGENGATFTFSEQKGASAQMQKTLEKGMLNYRDVIRRCFGVDPDSIQGAGAAGGLGTALSVFLGGQMRSGIETVLDLINFDDRLKGVDLVVTGEGRTDWQSCFGKVMQGVGDRAKKHCVPVVGLCGSLGKDYEKIYEHGIVSIMTTVDSPMPLEQALENAEELYFLGAKRMFRFLKAGMSISRRKSSEC